MKYLRLLLSLTLVAFLATVTIAAADSFDSDTATIQKAGANSAKADSSNAMTMRAFGPGDHLGNKV